MRCFSKRVSIEATVLGGFPIVFSGTVCFPDRSVGLDDYWVEDAEVLTRRNKPCSFIEKKVGSDLWDELEARLISSYRDSIEYSDD